MKRFKTDKAKTRLTAKVSEYGNTYRPLPMPNSIDPNHLVVDDYEEKGRRDFRDTALPNHHYRVIVWKGCFWKIRRTQPANGGDWGAWHLLWVAPMSDKELNLELLDNDYCAGEASRHGEGYDESLVHICKVCGGAINAGDYLWYSEKLDIYVCDECFARWYNGD